jgi:hypothetical protein
MGLMDRYFGQKSKNQINQEIVGRLENKILEELTEAEKHIKFHEENAAKESFQRIEYLKPIVGCLNQKTSNRYTKALIDYSNRFYQV